MSSPGQLCCGCDGAAWMELRQVRAVGGHVSRRNTGAARYCGAISDMEKQRLRPTTACDAPFPQVKMPAASASTFVEVT